VNSLGSSGDGDGEGALSTLLQRLSVRGTDVKREFACVRVPKRTACELGVSLTLAYVGAL